MNCENCNNEHDRSYGSGRFCKKECARSYSTKSKRKEINEKVSKKLTKDPIYKKCQYIKCNKSFEIKKKTHKFCSVSCSKKHYVSFPENIEKMSLIMTKKIIDGLYTGKLKSIKCFYKYKENFIRCDSKVEYASLNYIENNFNVKNIERCNFSIKYNYKNKIKHYIPDFKITLYNNDILILECKAIISSKKLKRKWDYYYDTYEYKKDALISYCNNNKYQYLFFDQNLNSDFYYSCKPILEI